MVRKHLKKFARYALDRLKERSTRVGLSAFLASIGVVIQPEQIQNIALATTAIIGLVESLAPDAKAVN